MQRAMQIMVVVPDIRNPYYAGMYATVQRLANNRGFTCLLYTSGISAGGVAAGAVMALGAALLLAKKNKR